MQVAAPHPIGTDMTVDPLLARRKAGLAAQPARDPLRAPAQRKLPLREIPGRPGHLPRTRTSRMAL